MDTGELSGKPNEMLGVVALLLVALCYRNRDKFQLNGPLGSILFHPRSLSPIRLFSLLEGESFLKAFQHLQTGFNSKTK